MSAANLLVERTCHFSSCRKYRNELRIIWDRTRKPQMLIGLNPSKADEENNDPTVRRGIDFAHRWGAGGLVMANACAYRATDPQEMLRLHKCGLDVVGAENTLEYLKSLAGECLNRPIAAWGKHANEVRIAGVGQGDLLKYADWELDCLRLNGDGSPAHPLYLPATLTPIPFQLCNRGQPVSVGAGRAV